MYILGNKFNSKAQQIDENTKDIAELKEIVKTIATIYDASVEISTDAGTVNSSDVIQTIESIENAFILDTVGSLFRIIEVVEDTIYIMYVSTIRGEKGDQGDQGEQGEPGIPINPYPVNSIYMSIVDTNPSILFGGTWEQLKDRFLLGAGDTYLNGTTGGSKDAVVVQHSHLIKSNNSDRKVGYGTGVPGFDKIDNYTENTSISQQIVTTTDGVDGTDKNMPPYLVVYMWKRVA